MIGKGAIMPDTPETVRINEQPVSIENVLNELTRTDHWVLWCWEERDGTWTKPPYQVNGQYASSTNPETWVSFSEAVSAYYKGGFDGIGFVVTKETSIVGVDLDHCRDLETGDIEPWALRIVKILNSYTEITPSGTGLRIFIRGKLPPEGRKRGNIEMYDNGRFLTVTGWHLGGQP